MVCVYFQDFQGNDDLLTHIGPQTIEVNPIESPVFIPSVTLWPLIEIALQSHRAQGRARMQAGVTVVFNEIGEGEHLAVRMVIVLALDKAKGPDMGRETDIGPATGFAPTFQYALMHRTQAIHVVALIGCATSVHEGGIGRDQQAGLVVGHGIGSGKHRTGLAQIGLAIGKEQAVFGIELFQTNSPVPTKQ